MNINIYNIFEKVLNKFKINEIAEFLFVNKGTIKRWIEQKKVPNNYFDDLNRALGYKYKINRTARNKDQFYTTQKISNYCYEKTKEILNKLEIDIKEYCFIEPSAGCGNFYNILPKNNRIGIDIDPRGNLSDELVKCNFLDYHPPKNKKYIVIGNPPFGLRGNLALRFINHSYNFADVVSFILPPLFDSTGKGVPMSRVRGYKLAHSEKLPLNSFQYPNGKAVEVATIFQVWVKVNTDKIKIKKKKTCKSIAKVYSLSDGGTPSSTRNKKMLDKCHVYLPSTCFSGMKCYHSFESLPNKRGYGVVFLKEEKELKKKFQSEINWEKVSFLSTNSAKNLRTDLIEEQIIKMGFYDK